MEDVVTNTKTCSSCRTSKVLDEFPKSPRNVGPKGKGVSSWCYRCCAQKASDKRASDPEKYRARNREWSKNNPDYQRNLDLKKHYGITSERYDEMLAAQGGKCAICGTVVPDPSGRQRFFSVDHDHITDEIRGLLCIRCNTGIGMLNDDVSLMQRAIDYVLVHGRAAMISQSVELSVRDLAKKIMESSQGLCYQRAIREVVMAREGIPEGAPTSMEGAYVTPITSEAAKSIVLKYEWLGTMGRPQASYGLWLPVNGVAVLAGVACFGFGTGQKSGAVCGDSHASESIGLERGVCVHWAPKNAASWFIPKAVAMASKDRGWKIFYAYSDPAAGEIGTVYQACNWVYIGQGPGHGPTREKWIRPDGAAVSSRVLRSRGLTSKAAVEQGWKKETVPSRGKYVWFEGTSLMKKRYRKLLIHPQVPYPKRPKT